MMKGKKEVVIDEEKWRKKEHIVSLKPIVSYTPENKLQPGKDHIELPTCPDCGEYTNLKELKWNSKIKKAFPIKTKALRRYECLTCGHTFADSSFASSISDT